MSVVLGLVLRFELEYWFEKKGVVLGFEAAREIH